jgi:hemimethylated DNA binding protein
MNRLTRSVYRSVLRFSRSKEVRAHGFRLDVGVGLDASQLAVLAENGLSAGQLSVESGKEFAVVTAKLFRVLTPSAENLDMALDALKRLNTIKMDLKEKFMIREVNSSEEVLSHRVFRVGDVLQNTATSVRGVVVGWTIDGEGDKKTQMLHVLTDTLDCNELDPQSKRTTLKLVSDAFRKINDPALSRVYNESLALYFSAFDAEHGRYVPLSSLSFIYPLDYVEHTDEAEGEAKVNNELSLASKRVVEAVSSLAAKLYDLIESKGFAIRGPVSTTAAPLTAASTSSSTASIMDDVVSLIEQCKTLDTTGKGRTKENSSSSSPLARASEACGRASAALSNLASLFAAIDQLLQLRFQSWGIGYFEELAAAKLPPHLALALPPTLSDTGSAAAPLSSTGPKTWAFSDDSITPAAKFSVGQVVRHKLFKYKGVITGYDQRPQMDVSQWEGVVGLPSGSEQPFYRVVPDEADVERYIGANTFRSSYYCAQENLDAVGAQTRGGDDVLIRHRHVSLYFNGFDTTLGKYRVPPKLRFCFPHEFEEESPEAQRAYGEAEECLLEAYALTKALLIDTRLGNKSAGGSPLSMQDLLLLLKSATRREDALQVESVLWLAWMAHAHPSVSRCLRGGLSNTKRGRPDAALEFFRQALLLDPAYPEPRNKMAALHHSRGEHAQCLQQTELCLAQNPSHFGALAGCGLSLERTGDVLSAIKVIRSALEIHPFAAHLPTVLNTLLLEEEKGEAHAKVVKQPKSNKSTTKRGRKW